MSTSRFQASTLLRLSFSFKGLIFMYILMQFLTQKFLLYAEGYSILACVAGRISRASAFVLVAKL